MVRYLNNHNGFIVSDWSPIPRSIGQYGWELPFYESGKSPPCRHGRRGIFRIAPDGIGIEHIVAGMNIVGLCFSRTGHMIVATNDSVYSIKTEIWGTLLS